MRRTLIQKYPKSEPKAFPLWMYRGALIAAMLIIAGMVLALSNGSDRQADENSPYQAVPTELLRY